MTAMTKAADKAILTAGKASQSMGVTSLMPKP